jgi:hypothetical protein
MIDRVRAKRAEKPARSIAVQVSQASPFGPPALLPGEDPAAYQAVLARFRAAVGPRDDLQQELVRDVVYDTWQIDRWRRFATALLRVFLPDAVATVLGRLRDFAPGDDIVDRWARGDAAALEEVSRLLTSASLTTDAVLATAFATNMALFESFEALIGSATARRERALREIERRQVGLARDLRRAMAQIDVIEPDGGTGVA